MRDREAVRPAITTTPLQKLLLIGFGLVLVFTALASVEAALSIFGIGDEVLYEDPYVAFAPGSSVFRQQRLTDGASVYATKPEQLTFFNPQEFPAEKDADAYRVFALGGSTTAGRPYDHRVAFGQWLQLFLEELAPDRKWEAVNAGAISYASYRIVVLMKELVDYSPDLFVVYTGHNEFLEERTYSEIIHQPELVKKLHLWLSGWRTASILRRGWQSFQESERDELESEVKTRFDVWTGLQQFQRDDDLAAAIYEHFDQNLRQMVRIARDHDVDLIFVKPASNLKDFSPFKSDYSVALTAAEKDRFRDTVARGRSVLENDDPRAALAAFTEAAELDASYAEIHFLVGKAHFALGDHEAAEQAFVRARDLDVAPLRATSTILESVEAVARETDTPLIDLPALLEEENRRRFGHRILGDEIFLDHVHPDLATHSLIADQVLQRLQQQGVVEAGDSWPQQRQQIVARGTSSLDREDYARRDLNLAKVLSWAGKIEESEAPLLRAAAILDDPELHLILGVVYQRTGRLQEALGEHQRAIALQPELPKAHFNLGVVYGRLGQTEEGISSLEEAIRLEPDFAQAHTNLGILLRRRGDLEAAVRALKRALQLEPEAAEIYENLGVAFRRQERWQEAVESFERSIEIDPSNPTSRTELAITYARQGQLELATERLEQIVESHPHHAEAHYNLGVIHSQQQRPRQALTALLDAIEAAPEHHLAHNNLAILYARSGRVEESLAHFVRAIEIHPEYAEAYVNLATVLEATGHVEQAAEARERARQLRLGASSTGLGARVQSSDDLVR